MQRRIFLTLLTAGLVGCMDRQSDVEQDMAVVDRVVSDTAVLLLEGREEQRHLPAGELPPGAGERSVLQVTLQDGEVQDVDLDQEETEERLDRAEQRLEDLTDGS